MKITFQKEGINQITTDLLALPLFEKEEANPLINQLPEKLKGEIKELVKNSSLKGEFGETRLINTLGLIKAKNLLIVGLGKEKELNLENVRRASALTLKVAKSLNFKEAATALLQVSRQKAEESAQAIAEGTLLADYEFNQFKTKKEERKVDSLVILTNQEISKAINKAVVLAEATNYVRNLVNLPSAIKTPSYLAKEALKLKDKNTSVKVYDKKEIEKMGMGGLTAVGSGSAQEPKFIVINYYPHAKKKIALVGKGLTFDSGGFNLKPTRYIEDMKQDMAGAGAVLGTIKAAQRLGLKINLLGIIPACENLIGSKAYKPGDILTAYNKKTIEVTNTDAEGRLILADALSYAEKQKPNVIIDLATLTGAAVVALGYWATALLTKDQELAKKLIKAGESSGERLWQLPLWDDYKDLSKSDIADLANSHKSYDAGTIEGGIFLSNFIEKTSWAHLDIAGTAWFTEPKFYLPKGGTGVGVRLLINYLENL